MTNENSIIPNSTPPSNQGLLDQFVNAILFDGVRVAALLAISYSSFSRDLLDGNRRDFCRSGQRRRLFESLDGA